MGKNRDRLSLVAAILDAANAGATKTRIMYHANLSYRLLEKYLETSIKLGFLWHESSNYTLTENGRDFLKKYNHFYGRYSKGQNVLNNLINEREKLEQLYRERTNENFVEVN